MRRFAQLAAPAVAVAACSVGCGGASSASNTTTVVAAFYPLVYAAEQTGGRGVAVTNLTPPGVEPHDVELSARDVGRVRDADVVLYFGSGFQPALERAVAGAKGRTVDLLARLPLRMGGPGAEEEADPHVWLDPLLYTRIARGIAAVLGRKGNAEEFAAKLQALDRDYETGLKTCVRRDIVTSHAAFGYLTRRYGLRQIALTGLSPEAEPTPRELERVVESVRRRGATTIFFETLVPPDLARTVARETGATTAVLDPIEGLTEEELAAGETYFSVMRENLRALRRALGCR
jgi:zinc transport system substrate-binding protein